MDDQIEGIIYIRTSTTDQTPENQIDYIVSTFNLDVDNCLIYKEQESAWKKDSLRPILENALKKARQVKVNVFLWDYDRLYRNRKQVVSTVKSYAQLGIHIRSARQIWLDEILKAPSPWNEIMFDLSLNIVGWIGEEESQKKSERVKAAFKNHKHKVKKNISNPWGRIPCDIDMVQVRQLRNLGLSYRKIAKNLSCSYITVRRRLIEDQECKLMLNNGMID